MGKKIDLTGQRFGILTVIRKVGNHSSGTPIWECRCDCGNIKNIFSSNLLRGGTKSCGCTRYNLPMKDKDNLTSQRFGKLTVLKPTGKKQYGNRTWLCVCDCGKEITVKGGNLKSGSVTSCGCLLGKNLYKHGMKSTSPIYNIWLGMRDRCNNPNNEAYQYYGGKGISVCEEWDDYTVFHNDMIESYLLHIAEYGKDNTSIDRINGDKGYSRGNCRWATNMEQHLNRPNTIFFTHNGITLTLKQWSEKMGIKYMTLYNRIYAQNWPIEKALTTPVKRRD